MTQKPKKKKSVERETVIKKVDNSNNNKDSNQQITNVKVIVNTGDKSKKPKRRRKVIKIDKSKIDNLERLKEEYTQLKDTLDKGKIDLPPDFIINTNNLGKINTNKEIDLITSELQSKIIKMKGLLESIKKKQSSQSSQPIGAGGFFPIPPIRPGFNPIPQQQIILPPQIPNTPQTPNINPQVPNTPNITPQRPNINPQVPNNNRSQLLDDFDKFKVYYAEFEKERKDKSIKPDLTQYLTEIFELQNNINDIESNWAKNLSKTDDIYKEIKKIKNTVNYQNALIDKLWNIYNTLSLMRGDIEQNNKKNDLLDRIIITIQEDEISGVEVNKISDESKILLKSTPSNKDSLVLNSKFNTIVEEYDNIIENYNKLLQKLDKDKNITNQTYGQFRTARIDPLLKRADTFNVDLVSFLNQTNDKNIRVKGDDLLLGMNKLIDVINKNWMNRYDKPVGLLPFDKSKETSISTGYTKQLKDIDMSLVENTLPTTQDKLLEDWFDTNEISKISRDYFYLLNPMFNKDNLKTVKWIIEKPDSELPKEEDIGGDLTKITKTVKTNYGKAFVGISNKLKPTYQQMTNKSNFEIFLTTTFEMKQYNSQVFADSNFRKNIQGASELDIEWAYIYLFFIRKLNGQIYTKNERNIELYKWISTQVGEDLINDRDTTKRTQIIEELNTKLINLVLNDTVKPAKDIDDIDADLDNLHNDVQGNTTKPVVDLTDSQKKAMENLHYQALYNSAKYYINLINNDAIPKSSDSDYEKFWKFLVRWVQPPDTRYQDILNNEELQKQLLNEFVEKFNKYDTYFKNLPK